MEILRDGEFLENTSICIGNFDGVHKGHKELIEKTVSFTGDLKSVVYTFFPHPSYVFGDSLKKICSEEKKDELIKSAGADILYKEKCNREFLSMSPDDFAKNVIKERLGAKKVVVGYDFTFGKDSLGNSESLKKLGEKYGFEVYVLEPVKTSWGEEIKSSAIRKYINDGDFAKVYSMLGRAHSYEGVVESGKKLGRKLGFPTANIFCSDDMVLPEYGVYATVTKAGGKRFFSVSNVGINPTVETGNRVKIETYIQDFCEDIYGKSIEIEFYEKIRKEEKFESVELLREKIDKDVFLSRKILENKTINF